MMVAVDLGEWWDSAFEVGRAAAPALLVLLGSFLGFVGSLVAGSIISRNALRRQLRADLVQDELKELRDLVTSHLVSVESLQGHNPVTPNADIGQAFSRVDARARATHDTSHLDGFQEAWDSTWASYNKWKGSGKDPTLDADDRRRLAGEAHQEQLEAAQDMKRITDDYETWLLNELT